MTFTLFNQSQEFRQEKKGALENKNGVLRPQANIQKGHIKKIYSEI